MAESTNTSAASQEGRPLLIYDLMRAQLWFSESVKMTIEAAGWPTLTNSQAALLGHVASGEHRPARLARSIGMTKQAVSTLVSQLQSEGILQTRVDPEDARALLVDFAPGHLPRRDMIVTMLSELERRLAKTIGEDRFAVLKRSLQMDWGPPVRVDAEILAPTKEADASAGTNSARRKPPARRRSAA